MAGASATDTVTVTVEGTADGVDSFGGRISGAAVQTEQITKPDGGTANYISMHLSGVDETQAFVYNLLAQPSGNVTVKVLKVVQNEPYGAVGYRWNWQAVEVLPSTLTFTPQNWDDPQAVLVKSRVANQNSREQVILVFQSSLPGQYGGIHVTVDGSASSVSGTSVDTGVAGLEIVEDTETLEQNQEPRDGEPAANGNLGIAEPTGGTGTAGAEADPHGGAKPPAATYQQPGAHDAGKDADAENGGDADTTAAGADADNVDSADGDTGGDEVTLDQVRAALEKYDQGDVTYEELLDLIRRYLAS